VLDALAGYLHRERFIPERIKVDELFVSVGPTVE
jgi:hypothetical protein